MAVRVVLVRHGERLDEADRAAWHRVRTEATRNDPPLTARGIAQSREAGEKLAALLRADGLDAGDGAALGTVYCSPTQRTADTAVQVAVQLRAAEVVPHHGLNCCAAAKKHGVELVCGPQPQPDTLHGLRLACWPPAGDPGVVNQRHRQPDGFVTTCVELAASAASLGEASGMPCPPVVLVTHREAIWEVQDAAARTAKSRGLRYQMEKQSYCSVEAFEIDPVRWDANSVFPLRERKFAKTGSGQTHRKLTSKMSVSAGVRRGRAPYLGRRGRGRSAAALITSGTSSSSSCEQLGRGVISGLRAGALPPRRP